MKKIIYSLILFTITALHISCGDFLEVKSDSEFTPKYVESLNEMLLGTAYPPSQNAGLISYQSLLDDDITCRPHVVTPSGQVSYYESTTYKAGGFVYKWQSDYDIKMSEEGSTNYDAYSPYYNYIKGANAALDYLDDMIGTEVEKNNVKAQAYALRAYLYFQLVNIYGAPYSQNKDALGVPLKLTSGVENRELYRNTVKEVYDQVLTDLHDAEKAYKAMGDKHEWKKNYRTNLPMVQLLLSRVYLYMEDWENAAKYAYIVMTEYPEFSLYDLNTLPVPDTKINYTNFISYDMPESIWVFGSPSDITKHTAITMATSASYRLRAAFFIASEELLNTYETSDLRTVHYLISDTYKPAENYKRAYSKIATSAYSQGYWIESGNKKNFGQAFRLSEAYLNYAEASAMLYKNGKLSDISSIIKALNDLRVKRIKASDFTPLTSFANAESLIAFVRDERRRELCYEDHRWFDLRRYGMKAIKHTWVDDSNTAGVKYELSESNAGFTMPIPTDILNKNTSLVQNPLGGGQMTN